MDENIPQTFSFPLIKIPNLFESYLNALAFISFSFLIGLTFKANFLEFDSLEDIFFIFPQKVFSLMCPMFMYHYTILRYLKRIFLV